MKRAHFIAAGSLALLVACSNSSSDDGIPATPATVAPTSPATSAPPATSPAAPTDCGEAPELPACRDGHEGR